MNCFKKLFICLSMMMLFAGIAGNAQALDEEDSIGLVQILKGEVMATRTDSVRLLAEDDSVFTGDTLVSGEEAFIQLMFKDGTVVTLGEYGRVELNDFVYDEDEEGGVLDFKATVGTMRFLTGEIAKQSPEAFKVETPLGTVGIRGTEGGVALNLVDPVQFAALVNALLESLYTGTPVTRSMLDSLGFANLADAIVAAFQGNVNNPLTFSDLSNILKDVPIGSFVSISGTGTAGDPLSLTPGVRQQFKPTELNTSAKTPKEFRKTFSGYDHNAGRGLMGGIAGSSVGGSDAPGTQQGDAGGRGGQGDGAGQY